MEGASVATGEAGGREAPGMTRREIDFGTIRPNSVLWARFLIFLLIRFYDASVVLNLPNQLLNQ
jgi:hypothetical protein